MDGQTKIQDEGITRTQTQNLHKMRPTLKQEQYHLQSCTILLRDLNPTKCPTHLFTWKRNVGQKFENRN
jgi:hypothetical protein